MSNLARKNAVQTKRHPALPHVGPQLQQSVKNASARWLALLMLSSLVTLPAAAAPTPATPSGTPAESRPYDSKLLRLTEILGAIHYLRELCGANEGQFWRDTMQELMKSEGSTAIRRSRLTRSFNQGYRSYSRTYNVCTPTARATIDRFLAEGAELADALATTDQ